LARDDQVSLRRDEGGRDQPADPGRQVLQHLQDGAEDQPEGGDLRGSAGQDPEHEGKPVPRGKPQEAPGPPAQGRLPLAPRPLRQRMKKLLVVRARGLSADQAVRGDMAWNVSDLIADGSFAPLAAAADLDAAVAGLAKD